MKLLVHQQLSYQLTGIFFKVHRQLGRFCRERHYCDSLEEWFKNKKVVYQREIEIKSFQNKSPKGNRVDFLIDNKIIVDIKAKQFITKDDYYQMQRYLQSSSLELGLLVNFRTLYLKPKRILNTQLFHLGLSDNHSDH